MSDTMKNRSTRSQYTAFLVFFLSLFGSATLFAQDNPNLSRAKLKELILKERFVEATETLRKIEKDPELSKGERVYYYLMKSDYFRATNRTDSSGRYLLLAKKSIQPRMSDTLIALVEFELGTWYIGNNDTYNSYKNYKSAMHRFDKANNLDWYTKAAGNYGILSFMRGDTTEALQTFRMILARSELEGDMLNSAIVHQNLGRFFLGIQELDSASFHFHASIGTQKLTRESNYLPNSYRGLAEVAMVKGEVSEAIKYYEIAKTLYIDLAAKVELVDVTVLLKDIYKDLGNNEKALEYSERIIELRAELYEENRARSIGVTQAELHDLEKTAKIRDLRTGIELERSRTLSVLAAGFGVLLLLVFVFVKWRDLRVQRALEMEAYESKEQVNQLEKDQLRHELMLKKKALTAESLRLIEKNEQIQLLREKMGELSKSLPEKYADQLNTLSATFRSLLRVEHSWEEFLLYFKEVHPDVHRVFDDLSPRLTLKEKRLLSLIYLELNTKEISKIAGISPDSVKKARTRLRKKLSLEESDSIRMFITGLMVR